MSRKNGNGGVKTAARGGAPPSGTRVAEVDPDYLELVRRFPLRPIRNEEGYDAAVEILDGLATRAEDELTPGERDYLDALTRFVEDYDERNYPVTADRRTPLARLKSLMETAGLTPAALGDILCSRPAASMVLGGKRELSKAQIRKLAAHFKMDAGYFLQLGCPIPDTAPAACPFSSTTNA